MSIDRIGKGAPPVAPAPEKVGSSNVAGSGRTFEDAIVAPPLEGGDTPRAARAEAGAVEAPRTAFDRWRAGEIDLNAYLDLKADEAMAHLAALPKAEIEAIRSALRERIASDPTLVELVHTATGLVPDPAEDK